MENKKITLYLLNVILLFLLISCTNDANKEGLASPTDEAPTQLQIEPELTPDETKIANDIIDSVAELGIEPPIQINTENTIEIVNVEGRSYELLGSLAYTQTLSLQHRYINEDTIIDVYITTIPIENVGLGTAFLDEQAQSFLASLPEFVTYGLYESAYAEVSQEFYLDVDSRVFSGRKVIARVEDERGDQRSLYLLLILDDNKYITLRYTQVIDSFDENEIMAFLSQWLKAMISESDGVITNPVIIVTTTTQEFPDVFPVDEREALREELLEVAGKLIADFQIHNNNPSINFDRSALPNDQDILEAVLSHELSHGFYITEEDIDHRLAEISRDYGLVLTLSHYETWGKQELVADLNTMALLSGLGKTLAIKKYVIMRGLPDELFVPFIIVSYECPSKEEIPTNEDICQKGFSPPKSAVPTDE